MQHKEKTRWEYIKLEEEDLDHTTRIIRLLEVASVWSVLRDVTRSFGSPPKSIWRQWYGSLVRCTDTDLYKVRELENNQMRVFPNVFQ